MLTPVNDPHGVRRSARRICIVSLSGLVVGSRGDVRVGLTRVGNRRETQPFFLMGVGCGGKVAAKRLGAESDVFVNDAPNPQKLAGIGQLASKRIGHWPGLAQGGSWPCEYLDYKAAISQVIETWTPSGAPSCL